MSENSWVREVYSRAGCAEKSQPRTVSAPATHHRAHFVSSTKLQSPGLRFFLEGGNGHFGNLWRARLEMCSAGLGAAEEKVLCAGHQGLGIGKLGVSLCHMTSVVRRIRSASVTSCAPCHPPLLLSHFKMLFCLFVFMVHMSKGSIPVSFFLFVSKYFEGKQL